MFDQFSIYDVMQLIGFSTSQLKGTQGYFDCPVCGGKKKFNINTNVGHGGVCRCAKCNVGGDKLDMYILASNPFASLVSTTSVSSKSVYQRPSEDDRKAAMAELEERLHLARSQPGYLHRVEKVKKQAEAVVQERIPQRSPEDRNAVYTAFLRLLGLSGVHKQKLLERGLTDADIERIGFGSTPQFGRVQIAAKLIEQGFDLTGIPGFFKLPEDAGADAGRWSVFCPDPGYFVPIRDKDGYIVSMQIRLNKPTTDKDKYRFFSSSRDSLVDGSGAESAVHVEMCSDKPRYLYVVEGAIKAYVARSLYMRLYDRDDLLILAIPGTSNTGKIPVLMEWLSQYDFAAVVEFFDLDKFTNPYVARDRDNLERLLKQAMQKWLEKKADIYRAGGIKPPAYVSMARDRYRGKGLDDHLKAILEESA